MWDWIVNILFELLKLIQTFAVDWGLSIIILVVIIRLLLTPLMLKSTKSTARMQVLQPKMLEIQERYTDDPQRQAEEMQKFVDLMKTFNRPIFCTEYLARPFGSTFETVLPVLKKDKVAAYDFGLVRGAMQCHYEWNKVDKDGNKIPYTEEPDPWFHDIFQPDGTPYRPAEVAFIKSMTGRD